MCLADIRAQPREDGSRGRAAHIGSGCLPQRAAQRRQVRDRSGVAGTIADPHYYFSLDDYLCGYRDSHWLADDGTLFARMVEPYLRNIVTLLSFGHDVIAEAMVLPASQGLYLRLFAGQRVTFVGVRCSLEVATRRELQRGNRRKGPINLDVPEFTLVHAHGAYDLEVDTSESAPADVAAQIMPVIDDPPHPSAFDRLRRTESAVGSSPLILSHDGRHRQVRVRAREDEEPAPDQRHDADRHVDQ